MDWSASSPCTHSSVPVVPAERRAAAGRESAAGHRSRRGAGGCSATGPTHLCPCAPAEPLLAGTPEGARRSAPGATRCLWTAEKHVTALKTAHLNLKVRSLRDTVCGYLPSEFNEEML